MVGVWKMRRNATLKAGRLEQRFFCEALLVLFFLFVFSFYRWFALLFTYLEEKHPR